MSTLVVRVELDPATEVVGEGAKANTNKRLRSGLASIGRHRFAGFLLGYNQ